MIDNMIYNSLSKKEIIDLLVQKDDLIRTIKEEKNNSELLNFPWAGNLGQWYWNVKSNEVVFNDKKVTTLGYSMDEVPNVVGFQFFTDKLHEDDYKRVMENMKDHLYARTNAYEVEYRIKCKDGSYKWFYDRGKITKRDNEGKPEILAGIVFDITESKKMEQDLEEANNRLTLLVSVDELTGIFNRRKLMETLPVEIKRATRMATKLAILMFDIDKFKCINDNYGHDIGDAVLKEVAKSVSLRVRETDLFCRWGGDEFVVILPNTSFEDSFHLAQEISLRVNNNSYLKSMGVTISIGVTQYMNQETSDSLLKKADQAMYKAKRDGGNLVMGYDEIPSN